MGSFGFAQGYFGQYALGGVGQPEILDLIGTVGLPVDLFASDQALVLDLVALSQRVSVFDAASDTSPLDSAASAHTLLELAASKN